MSLVNFEEKAHKGMDDNTTLDCPGLAKPLLYVLTSYLGCILCSKTDIEYVSPRVRKRGNEVERGDNKKGIKCKCRVLPRCEREPARRPYLATSR